MAGAELSRVKFLGRFLHEIGGVLGVLECRDAKGGLVTWRATLAAMTLAAVIAAGCGNTSAEVRTGGPSFHPKSPRNSRLASGPFRLVEHEDQYLNGVENEDRPPIWFLLVGNNASEEPMSEAGLVAAYVEAMRQDDWRVDAYSTDKDWWVYYGGRGSESVRIGIASRFVELATADEGYAPLKFRRVMDGLDEPLIVVSIDPQS